MRRWGWVLVGLLLLHCVVKARAGMLWEVLWMCHLASGVLALGLILDLSAVSAAGFLFHLSIAIPAYLLHLASSGATNWTSAILHVVTPLIGWQAWKDRLLPSGAPWISFAMCLVVLLLSRAVTPPELNVNLAFKPWEFSSGFGLWPNRIGNIVLAFLLPWALQGMLNRRKGLGAEAEGGSRA